MKASGFGTVNPNNLMLSCELHGSEKSLVKFICNSQYFLCQIICKEQFTCNIEFVFGDASRVKKKYSTLLS